MFKLPIFGMATAAVAAERQRNSDIAQHLAKVVSERLYALNIEDHTGQKPMWNVEAEGDKIIISTVIDARIFRQAKDHIHAVTGQWPKATTETLQLAHPAANARIHMPSDKLVNAIQAANRKGYEATFTIPVSQKLLQHMRPAISALPDGNPEKAVLLQHLGQAVGKS